MMKTEGKGERTLRSASPHRNTYKADFHAIKCSFDSVNTDNSPNKSSTQRRLTNSSNGGGNDPQVRGRAVTYGNRVHKIKNMFMQMGGSTSPPYCENSPPSEPKIITKTASTDPPSPSSPSFLCVQKNNFLNTGSAPCSNPQDSLFAASFAEKIIRSSDEGSIDKAALAEKFSETRKLFERNIKKRSSEDRCTSGKTEWTEEKKRADSASPDCSNVADHFNFNADMISEVTIEKAESQGSSEHKLQQASSSCRSSSLNAGPISRRLESFLADSDGEESKDTLKNEDTGQTAFSNWESPVLNDDPCLKQDLSSTVSVSFNSTVNKRDELNWSTEEASKSERMISERDQQTATSTSTKVDRAPIKISQVEVVRAELIVVQNETLRDNTEIVGEVNIVQGEKPLRFPSREEENCLTFEELEKLSIGNEVSQKGVKEEVISVEEAQTREQDHKEQVAGSEEEEEQEVDQRENFNGFASSAFGIENAAFDDDREMEACNHGPDERKTLAKDGYNYDTDYEEFPGLSEEEEPDPDRKVKFSTAPIKVK